MSLMRNLMTKEKKYVEIQMKISILNIQLKYNHQKDQ